MSVGLLLLGLGWLASQNDAPKPKRPLPASTKPRADLVPSAATSPALATTSPASARAAAESLRAFLERTGKFGTKNNRVAEVRDAQRVLGVTGEDGIVGPKTRKASRAVGVVLPLRKRVT